MTTLLILLATVATPLSVPVWSVDLQASRQFSWAPSGTGDAIIAWGEQLPSPGSCLDRRIVGAIASHTGSVAVTNIANDLVASVGDRTGMCSPMDTDGIQHISLVQISSTSNAVIYNGPTLSTNTPVTTVEAPSQQLVSAAGLPSGSSSFVVNKKKQNMMRSESVSLGTTGYVTCWNRERGSLNNLRVVCRMFNTDGTSAGPKYLIKKFPVTTDEEATSISLVNMQSDGTNGLSVDSFAIGITYFPPGSAAPQLWIGVFSWFSMTGTFVPERLVQQITFNSTLGVPKRYNRAIQIERVSNYIPNTIVAVYATSTYVVTQPIFTIEYVDGVMNILTTFLLAIPTHTIASFGFSPPSVVFVNDVVGILVSFMIVKWQPPGTTILRAAVVVMSQIGSLNHKAHTPLDIAEENTIDEWIMLPSGGLTGYSEVAPVGTGFLVMTVIDEYSKLDARFLSSPPSYT